MKRLFLVLLFIATCSVAADAQTIIGFTRTNNSVSMSLDSQVEIKEDHQFVAGTPSADTDSKNSVGLISTYESKSVANADATADGYATSSSSYVGSLVYGTTITAGCQFANDVAVSSNQLNYTAACSNEGASSNAEDYTFTEDNDPQTSVQLIGVMTIAGGVDAGSDCDCTVEVKVEDSYVKATYQKWSNTWQITGWRRLVHPDTNTEYQTSINESVSGSSFYKSYTTLENVNDSQTLNIYAKVNSGWAKGIDTGVDNENGTTSKVEEVDCSGKAQFMLVEGNVWE